MRNEDAIMETLLAVWWRPFDFDNSNDSHAGDNTPGAGFTPP
jgi:hypothetical protein